MPKGQFEHRPRRPIEERFWSKVEKTDGCWLWTGCVFTRGLGYGQFTMKTDLGSRPYGAHRVAWLLTYGTWPMQHLMHSCDVPRCVNPAHLREGTPMENNRDMIAKGRNKNNGKLTDEDVAYIREAVRTGERGTARRLAQRFGVSEALVSMIVHGKERTKNHRSKSILMHPALSRNRNYKVSDENVEAIRSAYAAGGVTQSELARAYGISQTAVSLFVRGARRT